MAAFFREWKNNRNKYHWASWKNMSFSYDEGGMGMRNLKDVCMAFIFKKWWIFRTTKIFLVCVLEGKVLSKSHPVCKKWDIVVWLTWKYMLQNRQHAEKHIQWNLKSCSYSFWWYNWLCSGHFLNFPHTVTGLIRTQWLTSGMKANGIGANCVNRHYYVN